VCGVSASTRKGPCMVPTLFQRPIRAGLVGSVALLTGVPVRDLPMGRPAGSTAIKKATSKTWSGYVDTNHKTDGTFRNVAASWNVPEIPDSQCPSGSYGLGAASVIAWPGHQQLRAA
jgi:hypothetical protein